MGQPAHGGEGGGTATCPGCGLAVATGGRRLLSRAFEIESGPPPPPPPPEAVLTPRPNSGVARRPPPSSPAGNRSRNPAQRRQTPSALINGDRTLTWPPSGRFLPDALPALSRAAHLCLMVIRFHRLLAYPRDRVFGRIVIVWHSF